MPPPFLQPSCALLLRFENEEKTTLARLNECASVLEYLVEKVARARLAIFGVVEKLAG